jgi:type II secretory pathway component PulF
METRMLKAQIEFFTKFGQMLNSGIPIVPALEILIDECSCPSLKEELIKARKAITDRFCLKDIMEESKVFSRFTKEMVASGEKYGNLDLICARISLCLEKELATRSDSKCMVPGKAKTKKNDTKA